MQRRVSYKQIEESRRRHGAAAVEYAIVLPVLITIVLGCVDFGRFAHSYIAVTNAARAGAGHAAMNASSDATAWEAKVKAAAQREMEQLRNFDATQLTVTATRNFDGPALGQPRLRVTVQYPFNMVVAWPLLPSSMTLSQSAEIRAIR